MNSHVYGQFVMIETRLLASVFWCVLPKRILKWTFLNVIALRKKKKEKQINNIVKSIVEISNQFYQLLQRTTAMRCVERAKQHVNIWVVGGAFRQVCLKVFVLNVMAFVVWTANEIV